MQILKSLEPSRHDKQSCRKFRIQHFNYRTIKSRPLTQRLNDYLDIAGLHPKTQESGTISQDSLKIHGVALKEQGFILCPLTV